MRYLFQGDSITDGGRGDYLDLYATGCGYPRLLEAELMAQDGDSEVMNCAVAGSRIVDLLARWKGDCLNPEPDVVTVLIGVNDVWHELENRTGVRLPLFEEVYRILIRETLVALPDVRMVLMGAYLVHGSATNPKWEQFSGQVRARRDVTRRLAEEYGLVYVDLQEAFDEAQKKFPAENWSWDGVHPTAAGHELIAWAWKQAMGI